MEFTLGRRGLLGYLKSLAGSNIVKIVPAETGASPDVSGQADGNKRLKVICGNNTSYLKENEWIGDKTPLSFCEVRVSPNNTVKPNIGSLELSEAISRVLPFTSNEDNRPILQNVLFRAKEGKLSLVSADGFRLAVVSLDCDIEGQALINRGDLKGIANALRKAKRANISFEGEDLIVDTELIRYKWLSSTGSFPDYEKLTPNSFNTFAHFDTIEAIRAISSLKYLSDNKAYPVDIAIVEGKIILSNPDDKGSAEMTADSQGEGYVRVDGKYLSDVLKASGGMVDFSLTNAASPMLFSTDGYQVVIMPMVTDRAREEARIKAEAQAKATTETIPEPVTEQEPVKVEARRLQTAKPKPKHKAKEPVAVA